MDTILICVCLGVMLVCGVLAVMLRSIIKDAICLAVASAALGLIMYIMGAPFAAVFEVSVCSGLITVIFVSGVSLSNAAKDTVRKEFRDHKRMDLLPVILIAAGAALMFGAAKFGFSLPAAQKTADDFREVFWQQRTADIWGQIVIMLTGGISISVLVKEGRRKM